MTRTITSLLGVALSCAAAFAADAPTVAQIYDSQLRNAERDIVSLAEAMPADKYSFAPTNGQFAGVRTFAQQVKHIAVFTYVGAAAVLGEKPPIDQGKDENGPDSIQSKEQILKFLKDGFAYGHKALQMLTAQNQLDMVASPFGRGEVPRLNAALFMEWHPFDHYGQMVEYARMNGVVPPSSLPRPPRARK